MAILKGSLGYTRFLVKGDVELPADAVAAKLNMFKFRPLHPKGEDNETRGWCPYLSEYDSDKVIEVKDFLYDRKLVICLRIDVISLPKALLQSLVKKSIAAYAKDHQKFPDKTVKKEIELAEIASLRARAIPKTKIIESLWCQRSQELRVFSRSKNHLDQFVELFQQTFLLRPERLDFAYTAWRWAKQSGDVSVLENLRHQPIFVPPLRVDVQ